MTPQEIAQFKILLALERDPRLTQRRLAKLLGVSNGKVHYLLVALGQKGLIKFEQLMNGSKKLHKIAYLLTPEGMRLRLMQTDRYLEQKYAEFEALKSSIAELKSLNKVEGVSQQSTCSKKLQQIFSRGCV